MWEGGPGLNSSLVDKVFLSSTRKFSQRPWPCIFP
jgi:hypothetical protein